ncbi:unnamed protein product, partial [Mesorhabditis spiculigera]
MPKRRAADEIPAKQFKRNARERERVDRMNEMYEVLQRAIVAEPGVKLSKLETLDHAIRKIHMLQALLAEADQADSKANVAQQMTGYRYYQPPTSHHVSPTYSSTSSEGYEPSYTPNSEQSSSPGPQYYHQEMPSGENRIYLLPAKGDYSMKQDYYDDIFQKS